jgi:hypothetical protein
MTKIMFHCNWGCSSGELLNTYKIHTPQESGVWNNIQATTNVLEADYHVIMDGGIPNNVPLNKVIYFQREEPEIKAPKLDWPDDLFFQGTFTDRKHHFVPTWRVIKSYDFLKNLEYNRDDKKHMVSSITSGKFVARGHKARVNFLATLVEHTKDIDIFGAHGIENFGNISSCFKGKLEYNSYCKFEGLYPYHYSLAFENSSCYNCVSEKPVDALLTWTMPIYWGCPNVSDYLPEGSYHHIKDIDDFKSIEQVIEIIKTPPTEENILAMAKARELILDKYNIWSEIETIIDEAKK